jgi:ABC-type branched-subunit amino acid transport system permease subunit
MTAPLRWLAALLAILAIGMVPIILPALGATFWVNVAAEILIWSLLAASVNLLLGYVGLLSFGQALYFGFGMYGVAIGIGQFGLERHGEVSAMESVLSVKGLTKRFGGLVAVDKSQGDHTRR